MQEDFKLLSKCGLLKLDTAAFFVLYSFTVRAVRANGVLLATSAENCSLTNDWAWCVLRASAFSLTKLDRS